MAFFLRDGAQLIGRISFETVEDAYAYVLAVRDYGPHQPVERWALVSLEGGGRERLVWPPGELLLEAEEWEVRRQLSRSKPGSSAGRAGRGGGQPP